MSWLLRAASNSGINEKLSDDALLIVKHERPSLADENRTRATDVY